jgi:hypothetical protein
MGGEVPRVNFCEFNVAKEFALQGHASEAFDGLGFKG